MRTLIRFFQTHYIFFLFLCLEGIGIFLLVQNNYIQRISFFNATNAVTGSVYKSVNNWHDYLHLREINQQLIYENTRLRSILPASYYSVDTLRKVKTDSVYFQRYLYSSATVINNSVNKQYNYITIDRGRNQGIAMDMAVTGTDGIVGIVYGVSDNFATVISVLNRNFRVSTKFKKNNYYGSLTWDGRSPQHAVLNEIALHVPVSIGDTLVVSGFSDSFPEGISVGIVDKVEQKDGSFYTIDVLLTTDFRKLFHVTVIEDVMKGEQQELEAQISQ